MSRHLSHRTDANQADIVRELSRCPGVTVWIIGGTIDLAVGYQGKTYLFDVKSDSGKLTPKQEKFFAGWRGHVATATTAEEILIGIGAIKKYSAEDAAR